MTNFLPNPWFDAQFQRNLGHASSGGADIGECLSLIVRLQQPDFEQWYQCWFDLGEKLAIKAQTYTLNGDHYSAYSAYLRASNYYRSSFFFLDENPDDPRITEAYTRNRDCFQHAMENSAFNVQAIRIPFEKTPLTAYLFLPSEEKKAWPLVIDTGGGDATKEELFFNSVPAALRRGYACLIIDGPGQGELLRLHKIPFRPDWETVISAVIDAMSQRQDTDFSQYILIGSSFGGYLAPRAATAEHRISACIANPGILNATGSQLQTLPSPIREALQNGDDDTVNAFFDQMANKDKMKAFLFRSRTVRFGVSTVAEMLRSTMAFNIEDRVSNIRCPTLIMDNEQEHITHGQAKKLYQALTVPHKQYHCFKAQDGYGGHCQPLSHEPTSEVLFSWLKTLPKREART